MKKIYKIPKKLKGKWMLQGLLLGWVIGLLLLWATGVFSDYTTASPYQDVPVAGGSGRIK